MNWTMKIPDQPTPNLVIVTNISPSTADKVATSSKTAIMLSNAMIGDRHIQVRGYFDAPSASATEKSAPVDGVEAERSEPSTSQDGQAKATNFMSDFLAQSYELSESLMKKAQFFDSKYGISSTVTSYADMAKTEALKLDQKLKVSERAINLDQQLKFSERLDQVAKSALHLGQEALNTEPGKKVSGVINTARDKIVQVHQESLSKMEAHKRSNQSTEAAHPTEAAPESTTTSTLYNAEAPQAAQPEAAPAPAPVSFPTPAPVDEKAAPPTSS